MMGKIKIGVKEIMDVTPGNPRVVPMPDPRQVECVSVLCSRQNRLYPGLPYKVGVKREPENGVFWIIAHPKKEEEVPTRKKSRL